MAEKKIGSATTTNMSDVVGNFQIQEVGLDSPGSNGITKYLNQNFNKWMSRYKQIPELAVVIDKKASWTIGKGYKSPQKEILDKIRGFGKDTFDTIIENLIRVYTIGGDSFAEIIKDTSGKLINLKPLNPSSINIIVNEGGIITGYEQTRNVDEKREVVANWQPEEIFHLPWNRVADEIHGISTVEKLEKIIDSRNEAMEDLRIVFHRYVKPLVIIKADTDVPDEILDLQDKVDKAVNKMENVIIPKDTVEWDSLSIASKDTLDPLPWITYLEKFFLLAEGIPEVIIGGTTEGQEGSAKVSYLAWQQVIEKNQRFIEQNIKNQLGIEINFEFPASLEPIMTGKTQGTGSGNPSGQIKSITEDNAHDEKNGVKIEKRE